MAFDNFFHEGFIRRLELFKKRHKVKGVNLATAAGINPASVSNYKNGSFPTPATLAAWAKAFGLNINWLLTDEGEMLLGGKEEYAPGPKQGTAPYVLVDHPVPIVGLASCGVDGIEQVMPNVVVSSPIVLSSQSFGVSAYGSSLLPLGISHLHTCYCDPDQKAVPGEIVFVRTRDNKGTLKLFLGEGKRAGMLAFKGWLEPGKDGTQKEFILELLEEHIDCIAPVILIRRRG